STLLLYEPFVLILSYTLSLHDALPISLLEQSVDLPGWLKDGVDSITDSLNDITLNFGKWFVQFFQSVVQGAFIIVLVPFFFLFMLKDHEKFLPFISSFFSGKKK